VIERVRRLPARAWDALLSGGMLLVLVIDVASGTFDGEDRALSVGAVALMCLLPLARRQAPLAVIYAWALLAVAMAAWLHPPSDPLVPFLGLFLFPYNAGLRSPAPRGALAIPAIWITMTATALSSDHFVWGDIFFPSLFGTLFWVVGRATASRVRLTAELHEVAVRADEQREAEAARAVADERRRIAREMHDVVAHSVSMMVIQAGGARRILDRDPARAAEAATLIESAGREALAEMRHLLGLLHVDDDRAEYAPQPTLARLDVLVERARAAGLPVRLEVVGERPELTAGLDLAAYRVLQEALTNVIKHGGCAPTDVRVHYRADAVEVLVSDQGDGVVDARGMSARPPGHGLVGMRERVRMYGGELHAGPRAGGGFEVAVRLPLEGEEDAALTAGARS
jgi:signal transduction histidine kinase